MKSKRYRTWMKSLRRLKVDFIQPKTQFWIIKRSESESLLSKTNIRQRQEFAVANNNRAKTSHPKRHRLTNPSLSEKTKTAMKNSSLFC